MTTVVQRAPLPQIVRSPEGIDLRFGTATASERVVAFAFDLAFVLVLLLLAGFLAALVFGAGGVLLASFVLRHGYFVWCETHGNGSTPGKRRLHLRVIRADGGPLTTEILLARNLTREIELFLPLMLLLQPDLLFAEHVGIVRLVASLWILLLLFFPLFNAQRLRIGDLLAGTRVVVSPPARLAKDLADAAVEFHFTVQQLSIYGEHELTVLEDLLRKTRTAGAAEALEAVTKSICRRIAWPDEASIGTRRPEFLRAFYTAQRQHLEQQLLLGRRRERKVSRKKPK